MKPSIPERICEGRKALGLTQEQLGMMLGVSHRRCPNGRREYHIVKDITYTSRLHSLFITQKENKHMKLITCEFNIDSGCVALLFDDGTELDIDCTAVESEYAHTVQQKTELDWLVYNAPLEYAQLVLNGRIRNYLHICKA